MECFPIISPISFLNWEKRILRNELDLFAYKQLRDTVSDCEDRYDEIERRIRFPQKASLAEEKQSMEFINLMERYLVELEDRLMNFRDVEYNGFVKTESEIIELFYFKFQDFPLLFKMDAVADYLLTRWKLCGIVIWQMMRKT